MSDSEEHEASSSGEEEEYISGSEQAPEADGFANVLNKILNQDIGNKNPVLAKRKTPIMKEQEAHRKDQKVEKKRREENKANREKQMTLPSVDTIDYERQLRKVSTRGVIALFNAIFQAKKDSEVEDEGKTGAGGKKRSRDKADSVVPDVKQLTQEKFLEMLKNGKQSSHSVTKAEAATAAKDGAATEGSGWNAIKDDYMIGQKISMKDWDKDEDSADGGVYSDEDNFEEILDEHDRKVKDRSAAAGGGGGGKKKARR